ncbi:PQQ-dependent sugar dehydrogenase [Rubripirellula sp.]|nr:PQQ-dependent sugar dehydrogenase [Rubripirellula sp.]
MIAAFHKNLGLTFCVTLMLYQSLAPSAQAETVDYKRFEKKVVATDLIQPMELAIAPDGNIFLIEIGGTIKLLNPNTRQIDTIGSIEVTTQQENGLIGLALDPDFENNGWLYLQYSPPDFSGQHVSRFTFRENQIDLASEKILFKYEEQRRECCHHAGSLEFGPDGNLYIGTGDNTNPFNDSQGYAPIDQRDDRGPWDAQRTSANTKNYNGKILRIHPEADGSYSIPDGNLFPKDGSVGHPEIYVMGCRNPWRINVDSKTGFLYWGDVGPDAGQDGPRGSRGYDEINQARAAGNFGWPYFIGDNDAYHMVDFQTGDIGQQQDPLRPINQSVNNSGSQVLPPAQPAMIYYPASTTETFPAIGSGGRTACAGPVYYFDKNLKSENKFPAAYNSTLFAFEWSRNMIYAVHLSDDGNLEQVERFLPEMTFIRPIDLQFDATGSLYVIEYGETWGVNPDAKLVRIDYMRGNRSPSAVVKSDIEVGREPLSVRFTGSESSDKDGESLTFHWTATRSDMENTETIQIGSSEEVTYVFREPGVYTVQLVTTDPHGASDAASLPIIVGNARPEIAFQTPQDGDFYDPSKPITYRMIVTDLEDGTNDPSFVEQGELEFIDSGASSRISVEAMQAVSESDQQNLVLDPGLELIRKSDCLNCHAMNRPRVGPSFLQIANKYRNDPHQIEQSVQRVLNGSTGVWGKVGMLPHSQHTPSEVLRMVEFVYSVSEDSSNPTAMGFRNELDVTKLGGTIEIEATYVDLGRDSLPKLAGSTKIRLRNRHLQAESADAIKGTQRLNSDRAEGKTFMGAIEHDGHLKFSGLSLEAISKVQLGVSSAGAGGTIEIRKDFADGPILGSIEIKVNGEWEAFYPVTAEITPASGKTDLYLVFKNETNRGGLMNVDWVKFLND